MHTKHVVSGEQTRARGGIRLGMCVGMDGDVADGKTCYFLAITCSAPSRRRVGRSGRAAATSPHPGTSFLGGVGTHACGHVLIRVFVHILEM